jgi:hypothetical protein
MLPLAAVVEEGGGEDSVQPGPRIRAGFELPEAGVASGESFLDQVFGVRLVAVMRSAFG